MDVVRNKVSLTKATGSTADLRVRHFLCTMLGLIWIGSKARCIDIRVVE